MGKKRIYAGFSSKENSIFVNVDGEDYDIMRFFIDVDNARQLGKDLLRFSDTCAHIIEKNRPMDVNTVKRLRSL